MVVGHGGELLQHATILFASLRLGLEGRWHSAVALFSAMIDSRRIPKAIAAGGYVEHVQQRQLPDVEGEQQQERTGARIPGSIDASRRLTPERAGGQGQKREDSTHRARKRVV